MRILILGGDGMLGHRLLKAWEARHEVRVTLRQDAGAYREYGIFTAENACFGVDVRSLERLVEVISSFRPEAVVNAVGIVKQRASAKEAIPSLELNALLPHRLSLLCRSCGARLIHISTDCVFSGKKGMYTEEDPCDPADLYGSTKLLGEVGEEGCLTLRTSIIGYELSRKKSLLEWFLAQEGTVRGFTRAIYSGFTTCEMARIVEKLLLEHPEAHGVYQVSSDPINKYDLLCLVREALGKRIEIVPDDSFVCDRSLDSTRFRRDFRYTPPSWRDMVGELAGEVRS